MQQQPQEKEKKKKKAIVVKGVATTKTDSNLNQIRQNSKKRFFVSLTRINGKQTCSLSHKRTDLLSIFSSVYAFVKD